MNTSVKMSDNRRNTIFADFIKRQFPDTESILDVASGDGRLAKKLATLYPFAKVLAIDPKPRGNKQHIRFLRGTFPDRIKVGEYDLIVGMHPDEATWPIVEESCRHRINFAVVPCCVLHVPRDFPGGDMYRWCKFIVDYTERHGMKVTNGVLPIRGANQVICGRE